MKSTHLLYLFFIVVLFISCGKKKQGTEKTAPPVDIITAEQMQDVLVDVLLAEGATATSELNHLSVKYEALHYYNFVLNKHKLTAPQFIANFNYYANDADQMEKIITEVINDLSQKQNMYKKYKTKEE
jgi:hypothetical protein